MYYSSFYLQWDYKTLNIVIIDMNIRVHRVFISYCMILTFVIYFCTLPHLHAISVCWQILGMYSKTNSPFFHPEIIFLLSISLWFSTLEPAPPQQVQRRMRPSEKYYPSNWNTNVLICVHFARIRRASRCSFRTPFSQRCSACCNLATTLASSMLQSWWV